VFRDVLNLDHAVLRFIFKTLYIPTPIPPLREPCRLLRTG